jgi:hypothetical protein
MPELDPRRNRQLHYSFGSCCLFFAFLAGLVALQWWLSPDRRRGVLWEAVGLAAIALLNGIAWLVWYTRGDH